MDKKDGSLKQALFVGRFQPFHLGHLAVIKDALGKGAGGRLGGEAGDAGKKGELSDAGNPGELSDAGKKGEDRLIIVVGSAEQNHEPENPFTAGERYQMIEGSLLEEGISRERFDIIPVRNIDNFILWTAHVEQYIPPVYKVYTGSPIVQELYRAYGKYEIEKVKLVKHISGTVIRKKMLNDDLTWEQLVPARTATLVKQWRGIERLKMVSG